MQDKNNKRKLFYTYKKYRLIFIDFQIIKRGIFFINFLCTLLNTVNIIITWGQYGDAGIDPIGLLRLLHWQPEDAATTWLDLIH
jgi:hypothetical protein